jgi:hypothetical protein
MASPYPLDRGLRESLRTAAIEKYTVKGVHTGLHYGQSMRCQDGDHYDWDTMLGCRNDGTGCLCLCHDRGRRE